MPFVVPLIGIISSVLGAASSIYSLTRGGGPSAEEQAQQAQQAQQQQDANQATLKQQQDQYNVQQRNQKLISARSAAPDYSYATSGLVVPEQLNALLQISDNPGAASITNELYGSGFDRGIGGSASAGTGAGVSTGVRPGGAGTPDDPIGLSNLMDRVKYNMANAGGAQGDTGGSSGEMSFSDYMRKAIENTKSVSSGGNTERLPFPDTRMGNPDKMGWDYNMPKLLEMLSSNLNRGNVGWNPQFTPAGFTPAGLNPASAGAGTGGIPNLTDLQSSIFYG